MVTRNKDKENSIDSNSSISTVPPSSSGESSDILSGVEFITSTPTELNLKSSPNLPVSPATSRNLRPLPARHSPRLAGNNSGSSTNSMKREISVSKKSRNSPEMNNQTQESTQPPASSAIATHLSLEDEDVTKLYAGVTHKSPSSKSSTAPVSPSRPSTANVLKADTELLINTIPDSQSRADDFTLGAETNGSVKFVPDSLNPSLGNVEIYQDDEDEDEDMRSKEPSRNVPVDVRNDPSVFEVIEASDEEDEQIGVKRKGTLDGKENGGFLKRSRVVTSDPEMIVEEIPKIPPGSSNSNKSRPIEVGNSARTQKTSSVRLDSSRSSRKMSETGSSSKESRVPSGIMKSQGEFSTSTTYEEEDKVWALYSDNLYHPATINAKIGKTTRYTVTFDTGEEDIVQASSIFKYTFKSGDRCLYMSDDKYCTGHVSGVTENEITLISEVTGECVQVEFKKVAVNKEMVVEMKKETGKFIDDRTTEEIMGPLPIKKRLFKGIGFVLTLSAKSEESDMIDRDYLTKQIEAGGGTILEISDLIEERKSEKRTKAMRLLLAVRPSRTRKFMLVLAMGDIPIVSYKMVTESCKANKLEEYEQYLLPNGWSTELNHFCCARRTSEDESKPPPPVFTGYSIFDSPFSDDWGSVLSAGGAKLTSYGKMGSTTDPCNFVLCEKNPGKKEVQYFTSKTTHGIVTTEGLAS
ncbi:hypothetical protein HK098_001040 [Nowakowskiella sp. JEL0407]|nr:hypothetical protein HK098_001040 [Nowakowskiella sp. JEL0407]